MSSFVYILFLLLIIQNGKAIAQDIPAGREQQLENQAESDQAETEDDTWLQELAHFRNHPLDINSAGADELRQLKLLNDLQVEQLLAYRRLLGKLISVDELQAVPSWNVETIRRLLPFITVSPVETLADDFRRRIREGEHSFLIRVSQVLEKSAGYDTSYIGNRYMGSPQRIFFRYRYMYRNLLQFGILGDKDAGEPFLKGVQKLGFDFYSAHLFARNMGKVQMLAIGDFTVNMGQGLVHWQGLAFKKSAEITAVKRQSTVLRPYHSAGEFYFHRGAGLCVKNGRLESTFFISFRKLSGNVVEDSLRGETVVTSLLTGGYHRTPNEQADRNRLGQQTVGAAMIYRSGQWKIGLNGVYYRFTTPLQKRDEPYNLYAISGRNWYNYSVDFSYTFRNMHVFGEMAADKLLHPALVGGMLISAAARVDIALLYRNIGPGYQSLYGNAFTENTLPVNERGIYAGISIRPANGWRLEAYADLYHFPWLRYLADAPGGGADYLVQLSYSPTRMASIYTRYRSGSHQANEPDNQTVTNGLAWIRKRNWRTHVSFKLNRDWELRARTEIMWYNRRARDEEEGFLSFFDLLYHPMRQPYSGSFRIQFFETEGFNSRIYAFENDVPYQYSIPGYYDRGIRLYLNLGLDIGPKWSCWFRGAITHYTGKMSSGTGLDAIKGSKRSEIRLQARYIL